MKFFGTRAATLAFAFVSIVGCASGEDEGLDTSEHVATPIVGGTQASDFPESALIEMKTDGVVHAACSGAVIAPQVVLTAGHCVAGFTGWNVRAPFSNQAATSTSGETFDWKDDGSKNVNGNLHDIGLVYLDRPITLSQYPKLADHPVPNGTNVVNIGRINNGTLSSSALFVGKPLSVATAELVGFPYDYVSTQVIESGDSGGPVELPGTTPHALVAVNSGSGPGHQVLARVDLLKGWITERIVAHGGPGTAPPAAPSTAPAAPAPAACGGPAEVEPNDDYRAPNALAGSACGNLGGNDGQDWYGWSIGGATPYSVKLTTSGDATLAMWKLVNGRYARVQNTSPTELSHTSSGAGSYVIAVFTPSGAAQPYSLALVK